MATGFLRVQGAKVVDQNGTAVLLRGAALGGWMNMENFITGFPGHEHQHRRSMLKVLGKEKYEFFFDKWLEYHVGEEDIQFFASLKLNCIRIPFNYRHFEDDMNPRVLKESGFKHLDRVINLCAKYQIYTILDMHTAPGGQNVDWHSDNPSNYAAFWDHKDHQDRTIWLWEQIAARYKDNIWVAGYNPINEPTDPEHVRLPAFYRRFEPAIRKVDSNHILWLDGNTFAIEWIGFEEIINDLPNCVYALHDYSMMGFPTGERYTRTEEQNDKLERQFLRKAEFMRKHNLPAWNGEFGPVYEPEATPNAGEINQARCQMLGQQLAIYDKYQIPWSIWLYKDIGVQGMVHTSSNSKWNQLINPILEKKKKYKLDAWGVHNSEEAESALNPLVKWIDEICPQAKQAYPGPWQTERHLLRAVFHTFLSEQFSDEFAELFRGKGVKELDELAHSFHFSKCVQRDYLNKVLQAHAPA